MNGFWNIVWLVFWAFAFVAYLMVLFTILERHRRRVAIKPA